MTDFDPLADDTGAPEIALEGYDPDPEPPAPAEVPPEEEDDYQLGGWNPSQGEPPPEGVAGADEMTAEEIEAVEAPVPEEQSATEAGEPFDPLAEPDPPWFEPAVEDTPEPAPEVVTKPDEIAHGPEEPLDNESGVVEPDPAPANDDAERPGEGSAQETSNEDSDFPQVHVPGEFFWIPHDPATAAKRCRNYLILEEVLHGKQPPEYIRIGQVVARNGDIAEIKAFREIQSSRGLDAIGRVVAVAERNFRVRVIDEPVRDVVGPPKVRVQDA